MATMRVAVLLFVAFAVLASCSLFGNYDLDGLPCDPGARPGEECLTTPDAGTFVCVKDGGAGVCRRQR